MFRKFVNSLVTTLVFATSMLALTPMLAAPVHAACSTTDLTAQSGIDCAKPKSAPAGGLFGGDGSIFKAVTNTLIFVIGAIAVVMVIIGGLRYVVSNGNASSINSARETILYSVVGLVVALFAYAIVNFVLTRVG